MDGHVGDDFPEDLPDDGAADESFSDGSEEPLGVGDAGGSWEDDTVDLDGEDAGWPADDEHPIGSDAVDFDAEYTSEEDLPAEPAPADAGESPDADPETVPGVGDDEPVGLGADPDLPSGEGGDGGWLDLPDLASVEVPEPAGGPPWVDTGLLGDDGAPADVPVTGDSVPATPEGGAEDLRAALGEPPLVGDPTDAAYQDLVASEDPAVRNLARLWGPPA
ncbi:hypothetical protein [Cryptosporangium aurantiacum]|uniref:Uncharacterized protein n=1 Tax=Cryptosporangium aurantiacum TaxID=134849 RepID=A0A1M7RIC5_9ACTN|nr:hypothetical protein [Cryptosporangium aurantiacum]SHN46007.1 hypothetical protein SAMN05443668_113130 [Cryptosporangium aurantiacum]